MGAFDSAFQPIGLTPSNTTEATLLDVGTDTTSGQDVQCLVNVSVIGGSSVDVRVGILPSGGSVSWILYDDPVAADNPVIGLGPFFLQPGDQVRVLTQTASAVTFTATGTESS